MHVSRCSQASIEIGCTIKSPGYAYVVHYTVLFHNQGCYYNSIILQALKLLPGASGLANTGWIDIPYQRTPELSTMNDVKMFVTITCIFQCVLERPSYQLIEPLQHHSQCHLQSSQPKNNKI